MVTQASVNSCSHRFCFPCINKWTNVRLCWSLEETKLPGLQAPHQKNNQWEGHQGGEKETSLSPQFKFAEANQPSSSKLECSGTGYDPHQHANADALFHWILLYARKCDGVYDASDNAAMEHGKQFTERPPGLINSYSISLFHLDTHLIPRFPLWCDLPEEFGNIIGI